MSEPEVFKIDVPPKFRPLFHRAVEPTALEDGSLRWLEFDDNANPVDEEGNPIPDDAVHLYGHKRKKFYIIRGGRGGGKSLQIALAAIQRSFEVSGVVLCCRETMTSIKDSLYQTLKEWIEKLGLESAFEFVEHEVRNKVSGSRFIFRGLKTNASEIRSTQGIVLCVIDEATNITKDSMVSLVPTIRIDGAEFFIAFNTRIKEDYIYHRFVENADERCCSWLVNLPDNPLAPKTLIEEMEASRKYADKTGDYAEFLNTWMGEPLTAINGNVFKPENIKVLDVAPFCSKIVRGWDLASSAVSEKNQNPDWTVGAKLGVTSEGQYIIFDIVRFRDTPDVVERILLSTTTQDGLGVEQSIPIDPGQAGKSQVLNLTRKLSGFRVHSSPESGDKVTRASAFASQVNCGNVVMVAGSYKDAVINEMKSFNGSDKNKDDIVDSLSRAFNRLQIQQVAQMVSIRGL